MFSKGLKDIFSVLIIPLIILIFASIYAGSWTEMTLWAADGSFPRKPHWHPFRNVREAFDVNSLATSTDANVLSAAGGAVTVANDAVVPTSIVPLPASVPNLPPPGVMQTPSDTAIAPSNSSVTGADSAPFPSLLGTTAPLMDPQTSILPTSVPNVVNSIPPLPPSVPQDTISAAGKNVVFSSLNPPVTADATAPSLPKSSFDGSASLPPALAANSQNAQKPYADDVRQTYDLQKYAPLFDELNDVSSAMSDNVLKLKNVSNKIRSQYVPNYPLPLMEVNAGF